MAVKIAKMPSADIVCISKVKTGSVVILAWMTVPKVMDSK